ncbi:hypothetical protein J7J83_00055 [bacterium]|nr:hypothetical protein [bacterium]
MNEKVKVPAGLKRCPKCGYYKGECIQDGKRWIISCRCNLQICKRCNKPVFRYRIGSNIYDEHDGSCWHVPIIAAWAHKCSDGVKGQLKNSALINLRTGEDLLHGGKSD